MGFGNKGGDAEVDLGGALAFSGFPEGFLTERRDGVEVLLGLRGQADHEIKLDETPSGGKDLLNGLEKIGLGVSFVDDPAQPLGPLPRRVKPVFRIS
jgi:hypothetical protein